MFAFAAYGTVIPSLQGRYKVALVVIPVSIYGVFWVLIEIGVLEGW